jgi:outer membrane murein-binding lipoprotein Lpp
LLAHLNNLLKLDDQTIGKAARMILSVAVALFSMYMLSGPVVESVAAEVFKKMLLAQGVDPQVFKQLQAQSSDNSKDIDELKRDANAIRTEIGRATSEIGKISVQVEHGIKTAEKVEKLVEELVRLQLQRSGSVE